MAVQNIYWDTVKAKCLTYEGDLTEAGVKQGYGKCTTELAEYVGSFFDDAFDGQGTLRLRSGNVYEGQFKGGLMHGRGKMTYTSGAKYEGEVIMGSVTGQGRTVNEEGVYTGRHQNGKFEGKGIMEYKNGTRYEGEWHQNLWSGVGTETNEKGIHYNGTFSRGKKSGRFIVDKPSGSQYVEIWRNGERTNSVKTKAATTGFWARLHKKEVKPLEEFKSNIVRRRTVQFVDPREMSPRSKTQTQGEAPLSPRRQMSSNNLSRQMSSGNLSPRGQMSSGNFSPRASGRVQIEGYKFCEPATPLIPKMSDISGSAFREKGDDTPPSTIAPPPRRGMGSRPAALWESLPPPPLPPS